MAALRSPWIGVPDDELLRWNEAQRDHYFETFFRTSSHPVALALKDAYLGRGRVTQFRPGQLLEALLKVETFDEELYMPLVALWHKAETLSSQGRRFEEVVQYFSEAIENEKIEKEVPAPAEKGMVRILTVHSSKGLQFPRVILTDFDGEYKSPAATQDIIWDRKKGVHLFKRDEDGKRAKDDPENVAWSTLEKQAQVAESKRVFYVALTRAQEELILVWKKEVKRSKASLAPDFNPHASDNWRAWVEAVMIPVTKNFVSAEEEAREDFREEPRFVSAKLENFDPGSFRPRHSPSEWMILSQCELRYRKKYGMIEVEPEQESPVSVIDLELEGEEKPAQGEKMPPGENAQADAQLPKSDTAAKGERIHALIETENWDELVQEFHSEALGKDLTAKLRNLLAPEVGTEIFREFGFEAPLGAYEALVGMMDRLEVNEAEKRIRIIDYKLTAKPKSGEALLEHYALQLKLYLWAAVKLVDFKPEKIEALLIHLTAKSVEVISAQALDLGLVHLDSEVNFLFQKARAKTSVPTLGVHCRYCEFVSTCPAKQSAQTE